MTMNPSVQHVEAFRAGTRSSLEQDLAIARKIAQLMDAKFELASVKVGLDSIVGLLPVAGDVISFGIGLYPVFLARKHKLGKLVVARMLANLGADFLVGAVPLVGDVADVFFKANLKNLKLLESAIEKQRRV
ncbi:MAG: DUF4112 domain-containing protein [Tepidisphaeraceae bacterium]